MWRKQGARIKLGAAKMGLLHCPKRGPGRPPKGSKPKRGPKALDPGEIDRELRQTGDAFLNELFPHGVARWLRDQSQIREMALRPCQAERWPVQLMVPCPQGDAKGSGASEIQEWLGILGQNEADSTPQGAKEKAAGKYAAEGL